MAFGHKASPSKIYHFHARAPVENAETVSEHIFRAHRYRNALVELELQRRERSEEAIRRAAPSIVPLDAQVAEMEESLEDLRLEIRRAASENRSRKAVSADSRAEFDELVVNLREVRRQRDALRKAAYAGEAAAADLAAVAEWTRTRQHELRAAVGTHWGTYLTVEDGASDFRKGAPPRFRRWEREGKIAVQIQKGMTWQEACDEKSSEQGQFHVEVLPGRYRPAQGPDTCDHKRQRRHGPASMRRLGRVGDRQHGTVLKPNDDKTQPAQGPNACDNRRTAAPPDPDSNRQRRCPYRNCLFWIRIGTIPGTRKPIWAKVPVVVHRPIPEDARIKWVYLRRRRLACHDVWSVELFLSRDVWPERGQGEGVCGIDVGWRTMEDGSLRVACLVDGDDRQEELRIASERIEHLWNRPDELRSQRDLAFNAAMTRLMTWMDGAGVPDAGVYLPDWLAVRRPHMHAWRSQAQLAGLTLRWRENRFNNDGEMYEALEAWRRADRKLYEEEANLRRKAGAWRSDFYRNWALSVRKRFCQVAIEDCDWRKLLRRPEAEDGAEAINETARRMARIAAVGLLREILMEKTAATKTPAEFTTQDCHVCGARVPDADYAGSVMVDCPACDSRHDQDFNAARNLRDALCESVGG
jgi:hypothetical protein